MAKKDQDQESVDPVGAAVENVDMLGSQRDDFVIENRYSPEREAAMRAYRQSFQTDAPGRMAATRSVFAPVDVSQPRQGGDAIVFDPAEHTIPEVEEFAADHPELVGALLEVERAQDKPRVTLVEALEKRQASAEEATGEQA
jgi:hypothetical protein